MATPPTTDHMDSIQKSLEKLQCLSGEDSTEILRSRINEQSSLICLLKQSADELVLQCQALRKVNMALEDQVIECQKETDRERKRADLLENRFMVLADNNRAIISFMDEYKNQNAQLQLENKELQLENETLFSKKLQDKEAYIQNLLQETKQLKEEYTTKENEYRDKLAGCQSKLLEQESEHQTKEAALLDQLHNAQGQQRDALEMFKDLKLKLQKAIEDHAAKETNMKESITSLIKEKDKLLYLSIERGRVIQEKQEQIQQLETKWKEEKKARVTAEYRFEQEAEAVNTEAKVKSLQSALAESGIKYAAFEKDFEAYKEHSTKLLTQERELNKKLRHMMG